MTSRPKPTSVINLPPAVGAVLSIRLLSCGKGLRRVAVRAMTLGCSSDAGHRFPAEIISHAVWHRFRFPLRLRMGDESLAARGILVSHATVRQWAPEFGQGFVNQIRRRLPAAGDKRHVDDVVLTISGAGHRLWRAVGRNGTVLDILVQSRRDTRAAGRPVCKLPKRQCRSRAF